MYVTNDLLSGNINQKYKMLVEKLLAIYVKFQRLNECNAFRINQIKKLLKRRERDVALLKKRLDRYNDNWRALPVILPNPKRKIQRKRGPKPKVKSDMEGQMAKSITDTTSLSLTSTIATDTILIPKTPTSTPSSLIPITLTSAILTSPTPTATLTTTTTLSTPPKKIRKPRAKRIDSEKDESSPNSSQFKSKIIRKSKEFNETEHNTNYFDIRDIRLTEGQVQQMRLLQSPKSTVQPVHQNVYQQF